MNSWDASSAPSVGRYELVERIGEGAMGVVYEARDPQLDRRVALKVMKGRSEDPNALLADHARIREEATTLAKLSHPNIVEIYDVGETDGRSYIAMEYVAGSDLAGWIAAEHRDWRQVVEVFIQVGRGLEAAHAVGLVHRDIKPGNILIGEDGRTRVADFGLAAPGRGEDPPSVMTGANPSEALSTVQSRPLPIMGTLGYMAPEQLLGEIVDLRADVFGMCATMWEALHGTPPFPAKTGTQAALALLGKVRPKAPRGSKVPRWLHRICRRGLNHARWERWSSAGELVGALEGGHARALRRRGLATAIGLGLVAGVVWWSASS